MSKDKKSMIFFFTSKIITGLLGLYIINMYSRVLSTNEYGNFSLISGLCSALISIFIGWIGSSVLRYYVEYKNEKKAFFNNVWIYTISMIIIMIIIELLIGIFSKTIPILTYLLPTLYFTISYSLSEVMEKALRSSEKTLAYILSMILQSISAITIFLVLNSIILDGTNNVLISTASSRLIFSIISIITISFFVDFKTISINRKMLNQFLKFGIPMIGVWGVSWILNYFDRYIIALFFSNSDVGIYDMSYKLSESTINVIITSFTLAVYPILVRTWKNEGKEKVEKKIEETIKYYIALVLPAVCGLCFSVNNLYTGVLDKQYIGGKNVIIIVSIGMFFNGLTAIFNKIWQLTEKTKNILNVMIFSVIINILLNIIFIPIYGMNAAAFTTLIAYMFSMFVTYILTKKDLKIAIKFTTILKIILATSIMCIFIFISNKYVENLLGFIIEIICSAIIYFTIIYVLGVIKKSDFIKEKKK